MGRVDVRGDKQCRAGRVHEGSFGLEVDEARKQRDVDSIVNDDFFQQLSERADDLRRQREQ